MIAEAGRPVARLVLEEARRAKARQLGTGRGEIVIHDSFHDDLPGRLLDLFEGEGDDPPGSGDQPLKEHEGR